MYNTYNPSVRVGNWQEDIVLEEDQLKDFLAKKERGELLMQKTQALVTTILQNVDLTHSADQNVRFGDTVVLLNKGRAPASATPYVGTKTPRPDTVVAANLKESEMLENCRVMPCPATASTHVAPSFRNAFTVCSVDNSPVGEILRYGQPFALKSQSGVGGDLFVSSDSLVLQNHANYTRKSRHQEVSLTDDCGFKAHWKLEHINPQFRFEYEFSPVAANAECIMTHCKTGLCLALEPEFHVRTPFGMEYELSVHKYVDSHKSELNVNHWMLGMFAAGTDAVPFPNDRSVGYETNRRAAQSEHMGVNANSAPVGFPQ